MKESKKKKSASTLLQPPVSNCILRCIKIANRPISTGKIYVNIAFKCFYDQDDDDDDVFSFFFLFSLSSFCLHHSQYRMNSE